MTSTGATEIYDALHALRRLDERGPARDRLWIAIWRSVTTRHLALVRPRATSVRVQVTDDYATVELLAAWHWLCGNELQARSMPPERLHAVLRSVATMSFDGSGRAAMADEMLGVTHVPAGVWVHRCDEPEPLAS